MKFLLRLLINAAALWVAVRVVDGVTFTGQPVALLGVALVFGLVNGIIKPILMILTFPALILTLGLFTFVLNALMLWLTSALSGALGLGFHVSGFKAAFLAALVITVVSWLLSLFVAEDRHRDDRDD